MELTVTVDEPKLRNSTDIESPVIATGRGGSGTRLLSRLLGQLGVFLGNELNESGDGLEWVDITREMLRNNVSIADGNFDASWRDRLLANAQTILDRADDKSFNLWGWKLPELMHLYPEFLDTFPKARLIVLMRHPINLCLRRTHVSSRLGNPVGDVILPAAYQFLGWDVDDIGSQEAHINNAVSWEFQIRQFVDSKCIEALTAERLLILRYEELAQSSARAIRELYSFLFERSEPGALLENTLEIDVDRINHIDRDDDRIDQVWAICGETAARIGYSRDDFIARGSV